MNDLCNRITEALKAEGYFVKDANLTSVSNDLSERLTYKAGLLKGDHGNMIDQSVDLSWSLVKRAERDGLLGDIVDLFVHLIVKSVQQS